MNISRCFCHSASLDLAIERNIQRFHKWDHSWRKPSPVIKQPFQPSGSVYKSVSILPANFTWEVESRNASEDLPTEQYFPDCVRPWLWGGVFGKEVAPQCQPQQLSHSWPYSPAWGQDEPRALPCLYGPKQAHSVCGSSNRIAWHARAGWSSLLQSRSCHGHDKMASRANQSNLGNRRTSSRRGTCPECSWRANSLGSRKHTQQHFPSSRCS